MMSTMQRPFSKPEDREEFWDSYLKKDFVLWLRNMENMD